MSSVLDLFYAIAERAYLLELQLEGELHLNDDDLLDRLDNDTTVYELHNRQRRTRLEIESLTDEQCKLLFRFTFRQLKQIASTMQLGEYVSFRTGTSQQFSYTSVKALAIMLRRLAYPSRLFDLEMLFGIDRSTIGVVFNAVIELIYEKYRDGIRYNKRHLHPFNLRNFSAAIVAKGSCYREVVGFIDGTLNAICRPGEAQESVYNGHVRQHGIKYQAIVSPDEMTVSLCGPFAGSIHDQNMLDSSNILEELVEELDCRNIGDQQYATYGDPAYRESDVMIRPILSTQVLNSDQRELNQRMATVRECVEWEFGHISTLWAFLKFRHGQKLRLSCVGLFHVVAALMKNIHIRYKNIYCITI